MKTTVSDFQKRIAAAEKDLARIAADLDELRNQRAALAEGINTAIDTDDFSAVEQLTEKQTALDNKIRAAEMILERKREKGAVPAAEIVAAANVETAAYQKQINKLQAEATAARLDYLRKVLAAAELLEQAWKARAEYAALIPGIEDPQTYNAQTRDFETVSHSIHWNRCPEDETLLKSITPDALHTMANLTRNRTNLFVGRDYGPIKPDVTVEKKF